MVLNLSETTVGNPAFKFETFKPCTNPGDIRATSSRTQAHCHSSTLRAAGPRWGTGAVAPGDSGDSDLDLRGAPHHRVPGMELGHVGSWVANSPALDDMFAIFAAPRTVCVVEGVEVLGRLLSGFWCRNPHTAEANSHVFAPPGSQEPCLRKGAEQTRFLQYSQTFGMQRGGSEFRVHDLHLKPRTELRTVSFADAHVEAWHEAPLDPNSTASGGAFFSEASFTLTRSRLTATWNLFKFRILSIYIALV